MDLRQLKTFCTVAHLNSFQQAASILHYAQSTVSEQIRNLEADLGVKLFERLGRQIRMTESGECLLQYAQRMIDLEEELKSDIIHRDKPHGSLSLRIPETLGTYLFPQLLYRFHRRFPQVLFHLQSCSYFSLQQELRSGIIQLGFLITDEPFQAIDLESEVLGSLRLILICHPDHPLSSKACVTPHDIRAESFLLPREDCSYPGILHRALIRHKMQLAKVMEFNSIEAIKQAIIAGTGMTMIPEISVRRELAAGRVSRLSWAEDPVEAQILMIYKKQKWMSANLQACIEAFREEFNADIGDGVLS